MSDLFSIIKSTPIDNFKGFGYAVGYIRIFKSAGLSMDMLNAALRRLEAEGKIELCCINGSADSIVAVKVL